MIKLLVRKKIFSFLLAIIFANQISAQIVCVDSVYRPVSNLGLYRGDFEDVEFIQTKSNRIIATLNSVFPVYITDDSSQTWYKAFPSDSLEYDCGNRGWGGAGGYVHSNHKGWVATSSIASQTLTGSIVLNYFNGDTNYWFTAVDDNLLSDMGLPNQTLNPKFALNDFSLLVLYGPNVIKIDSSSSLNYTINSVSSGIPTLSSNMVLLSVATANNNFTLPYYIALKDSNNITNDYDYFLYKYDGSVFSKILLPSILKEAQDIYCPLVCTTGDTIVLSGRDTLNAPIIFRSFDGGNSWINISLFDTIESINKPLIDVESSNNWKSLLSQSNGSILIASDYVSFDLGISWKYFSGSNAIPELVKLYSFNKKDSSLIIQVSEGQGSYTETGYTGNFIIKENINLEAVKVIDIDKTPPKSLIYAVTNLGLAYTISYNNDTLDNYEKWRLPYGYFPINPGDPREKLTAVCINPYDSLNVILGSDVGFYTTLNGPFYFLQYKPSTWNLAEVIYDIEFISPTEVIAVSGPSSENDLMQGRVWKSNDKGLNWVDVSPSSFTCGLSVAVGTASNDTVVYVGSGISNDIYIAQSNYNGNLYKSEDKGLTWTLVAPGPSSTNFTVSNLPVNDISVDPRSNDSLYLGCGYGKNTFLMYSDDGGVNFSNINFTIDTFAVRVVEIDPNKPDTAVYFSLGKNIGLFSPANDTVIGFYRGFPGENILDIEIGSILTGTTTGFYTIDYEPIDDLIYTSVYRGSNNQNFVKIFPNPFNNSFIINIPNNNLSIDVEVFNILGNMIYYDKLRKEEEMVEVFLGYLPKGVYILKLSNFENSGNQYYSLIKDK